MDDADLHLSGQCRLPDSDSHRSMVGELMYIQNAMNSLRKQISYFHPGLKYVRLKKEDVSVKKLLHDHLMFYKAKCEQYGISAKAITAKDVKIRMNVGLFNQVLDNLFSNSLSKRNP